MHCNFIDFELPYKNNEIKFIKIVISHAKFPNYKRILYHYEVINTPKAVIKILCIVFGKLVYFYGLI